jgi:hypothetical protein
MSVKNKKLTYLLGLLVLSVWGIIIYRIFIAAHGEEDNVPVAAAKTNKEAYNDFSIPKDTTHLLLNYRDPFGLVKQKDTTVIAIRKISYQKTPAAVKPVTNWGFIQYSGYILNPGSKKLIALVSINGQNMTLSEGETKARVKLIRNLRDSIRVRFDGKTKCIAIKAAAL